MICVMLVVSIKNLSLSEVSPFGRGVPNVHPKQKSKYSVDYFSQSSNRILMSYGFGQKSFS